VNISQQSRTTRPRGEKTKKEIIRAALIAFKENGFDETTIQDICRVSKIAVGTFYHHFSSKQDLAWAMNEEINESLAEYYQGLEKSSYTRAILQVVDYQIETYLRYGVDLIAKMYSSMAFSGKLKFVLEKYSLFQVFRDALSRGQMEGQFSLQYPIDFLVETVFSLFYLNGVLWCNQHDICFLKENARQKIEWFLRAISTDHVSLNGPESVNPEGCIHIHGRSDINPDQSSDHHSLF
jgi:AcrR family transcriptional regulator